MPRSIRNSSLAATVFLQVFNLVGCTPSERSVENDSGLTISRAQNIIERMNAIVDESLESLKDDFDANNPTTPPLPTKELEGKKTRETTYQKKSNAEKSFSLTEKNAAFPWTEVVDSWKKAGKNTCQFLSPLVKNGSAQWTRPFVFAGLKFDAGAAIQVGGGFDLVWDLYNLQFAAFRYYSSTAVIGDGMAGSISATNYLGVAFGVRENVITAWEGVFSSAGVNVGLPGLSTFLSGSLSNFAAANMKNGKLILDTSLVGAAVGTTLAFGVPSPLPGSISVADGLWKLEKTATENAFQKFRRGNIAVSKTGPATCENRCIRFDSHSPKSTYTKRALQLSMSIPMIIRTSKGQFTPKLSEWTLLALSIGATRDTIDGLQACEKTLKKSN